MTRIHTTAAERGWTYATDVTLVVFTCARCGIPYGLPEDYIERRRQDGRAHYCPNGHSLSYHETEADKLRRRLKFAEDSRARAAAQRDQAKASARAHKGHVTRIKKRIANGVCPCCNRTFKDVARHMKSQHPEFDPASTEGSSE